MTAEPVLVLGTRRSKLATVQAQWVADKVMAASGRTVRLEPMSSAGDESQAPITDLGGTGVFVTRLREALLRGDVDFVVHSFKDLPTAPELGLILAAVPVREDIRDAIAWPPGSTAADRTLTGARIGTGSPRRAAQLLAAEPSIDVIPLRGNVDSRLQRVTTGELDGAVLAMAGLARLGLVDDAIQPLAPTELAPAPAQGALAVECRVDDHRTREALSTIDHKVSRALVVAERSLLRELEAGCTAPVGAWAELTGKDLIRVHGLVAAPDGSATLRREATGRIAEAETLGRRVALALLDGGAAELIKAPIPVQDPRTPPRFISNRSNQ